jgi:hypothetical protein
MSYCMLSHKALRRAVNTWYELGAIACMHFQCLTQADTLNRFAHIDVMSNIAIHLSRYHLRFCTCSGVETAHCELQAC